MEELGLYLRSAREKQGFSLADIAGRTKIKESMLAAIEQGDYEQLPGSVYIKAFLRLYAREVGLDSVDVVRRYEDASADKGTLRNTNVLHGDEIDSRETKFGLPGFVWQWGFVVALLITFVVGRWIANAPDNKEQVIPNARLDEVQPSQLTPPLTFEGEQTPSGNAGAPDEGTSNPGTASAAGNNSSRPSSAHTEVKAQQSTQTQLKESTQASAQTQTKTPTQTSVQVPAQIPTKKPVASAQTAVPPVSTGVSSGVATPKGTKTSSSDQSTPTTKQSLQGERLSEYITVIPSQKDELKTLSVPKTTTGSGSSVAGVTPNTVLEDKQVQNNVAPAPSSTTNATTDDMTVIYPGRNTTTNNQGNTVQLAPGGMQPGQ